MTTKAEQAVTSKKLESAVRRMKRYPELIKEALSYTRSDDDMIDVLGQVKANERKYADTMRGATKELGLEPNVPRRGRLHGVEISRKAERSYNIPNLMAKLQGAGFTLMDLIEHDVVSVNFKWSNLKQFAAARGIDLKVVDHEVTTLGNEKGDVGEVWGDSYPRWS